MERAASAFNGGFRSFPPSRDRDVAARYQYQPPNEDYERLFFQQVRAPQRSPPPSSRRCAGWLLPGEDSVCPPILVAHSLIAAIWLVKEMLAEDTLPADAWQQLVSAAEDCAEVQSPSSPRSSDSATVPPPSAQALRASPLLPTKRRAPSPTEARPATSKRLRHSSRVRDVSPLPREQLNASQASQLAATPQLTASTAPEPVAPEPLVTSVTNNNRRAERQREKHREAAREQEQKAAGLVAPPPQAPDRERRAYASVEPEDAVHVSWLFKQAVKGNHGRANAVDLFSSVSTPYSLVVPMIDKARSVGDTSVWVTVAAFLRQWRTEGTPFGDGSANASNRPPASSRDLGLPRLLPAAGTPDASSTSTASTTATSALAAAWTFCDRYEQDLDIIHIKYRWAMAFLGKAYMDKVREIEEQEGTTAMDRKKRRRDGQGKVTTEAIDTIMLTISPSPTPQQRPHFKRRLYRALSWYKIAGELGWGMLCLMPHERISNSWIEHDLLASHTEIWCSLVTRLNPAACTASRALDEWLGSEGLAGGSIRGKQMLCIEDIAPDHERPGILTQVTEVVDSEDGEEQTSEEEEEAAAASPPKQLLRQRTLLELFRPQSHVHGSVG